MSKRLRTTGRKTLSVFLSATTALWLSGGIALAPHAAFGAALTQAQIDSILNLLTSFGADQSVINNVSASLTGGTPSGGTGTTGGGTGANCGFTRSLKQGDSGADVQCLQRYLNDAGFTIASSGVGSPGNETTFFGSLTKGAVIKWQNAYTAQVLAPVGLSTGSGFFGSSSRAHYNTLVSSGGGGGTGTTPPPATGTGLTVSAGTHPPANTVPGDAARVPFTTVVFRASADGDVTVSSVTVQRTGPSQNGAFSGVVLLDENGIQVGDDKSLNSADQAVLSEDFVVKAGQSRTMRIGANMVSKASIASYAGEVAFLSVEAVDAGSATVNGSFPIVGSSQTMNSTLTIGSVTMQRGAFDPGAARTEEVGITNYNFSSVKITAGSEKVRVNSIRWDQVGSGGASDLANLVTVVDGQSYPVVNSGDKFTSVFPGGIMLDKGFSADFTLRGDIVGGVNRTLAFDIAERADVNVQEIVGGNVRYGIIPPQTNSCGASTGVSCFTSGENPWYDGATVTINPGRVTVSSWTAGVPAANVAINALNEALFGFTVDVKGEPVTVSQTKFHFDIDDASGTTVNLSDLTNISIITENGVQLASPVDGSSSATSITFSDSITWPVGITNAKLVAKLSTDFGANDTIVASTTPGLTTDWVTVKGDETNKTVTPTPASAVTGSTQTVRAGSLTISVSNSPSARTIVAGGNQVEFSRYIFDAGQSGEDIRVTTIPLYFDTSGTRTDLQNCQLYDGETSLNPINKLNPATGDTASSTSLTFDGTGFIQPKNTSKTLSLKCDVKSGVTAKYWWGIDAGQNAAFAGATGVNSGSTIVETFIDANGNKMTAVSGGSYTVTQDTSLLYGIVQAGATDIPLAQFNVEAGLPEGVILSQMALALGGTASNSPSDLVNGKVSIWADGVQKGTATFGTGATAVQDYATSTALEIPVTAGDFKIVTIKGSFRNINGNEGTPGAFVIVNYDGDNNGLGGNYARGVNSGSTISGTSGDISTNGVRVFRSIPTVENVTPANTALTAGADLMRIKITAGARAISLDALTFDVATTGAQTTGFQIFGPSGAVNSSAVNAVQSTGTTADYLRIYFDATATDRLIQANSSKTFTVRAGTVSGLTAANTETLNLTLRADSAYPSMDNLVGDVSHVTKTIAGHSTGASTTNNFVWTPFSTTTPAATAATESNEDWTNGYGVPGFPSVGQNFAPSVFKD